MKTSRSSFESEPMEDAAERRPRVDTGARHGPTLGCFCITVRRFEARNEVPRSSDVSRPGWSAICEDLQPGQTPFVPSEVTDAQR